MTSSSCLVRIARSWERFRPFMGKKMKNPEGNCQFTKWASLSSLPHSHSSIGMDTAPSSLSSPALTECSQSALYVHWCVCVCIWERVRDKSKKHIGRHANREKDGQIESKTEWLWQSGRNKAPAALEGFLAIVISQCIAYCDLCYLCWGW